MRKPAPRHASLRRLGQTAMLLGLALTAGGAAPENAVEASYLVKFAGFVTWPATTPPATSFDLCLVGGDPFGDLIDQAALGQSVGGLPLVVRRPLAILPDSGCRIAYIADAANAAGTRTLARLRDAPVLTVTDVPSGLGTPGMINFVLSERRVRFDIDNRAARQAGLSISSKLLSLALHVQNGA